MVPVECVARGHLAGSGLEEYRRDGTVCGIALPEGLVDGSEPPEPIFTPATKTEVGDHDQNVSFETVVAAHEEKSAAEPRDLTLRAYEHGRRIARERGIILADTEFEFGRDASGEPVPADEVFTPDSSRYRPADEWSPGRPRPSFDEQVLRDRLRSPEAGGDRDSPTPPPALPEHVVQRTRDRYAEIYERLTGDRTVL